METKAVLVSALAACDTRELLEDAFKRYEASDLKFRIACMNECMGNPKTFYSSGENTSLENAYELTVQMFLTGAWKIAQMYKKLRG